MEVDLEGQAALVHGAGGPWGRAVADRLERSGALVLRDAPRPGTPVHMVVDADPALIEDTGAHAVDALRAAGERLDAAARAVADGGRVLAVATVFGLVPARGRPLAAAAAAAALFARTRAAALDLAPRRVRVNAVAVLPEHRPHTPANRAAEPEDLAEAALFLLAPAASYVTGEVLRLDGGWSWAFARTF